jgi:pimeloyl-ACP methyl ester carboxylesterase
VRRRFPLQVFLVSLAMLLPSCVPPTTVPIGTVDLRQVAGKRQPLLLVFLPGIRDKASVFEDEGFVAELRASGIKADVVEVDAHLGYYIKKQFLPRLKDDVIDPARKQGYRQIWLVGISLGGFGALWYDIENPGDVTGIVVFSPYLGEQDVIDEVVQAGGLRTWHPALNVALDDQHKIWQGLQSYESQMKSTQRVYLGYGLNDKFATADGLLAAVLPPGQVLTTEGGHDWPTWKSLWQRMLERLPLE